MSTLRREVVNERIKQLAVEAGMIVGEPNGFDMTRLMPKEVKFAELIVKECAEVIFKTPVEYIEIDAMHRIRDNVKSHFGVE